MKGFIRVSQALEPRAAGVARHAYIRVADIIAVSAVTDAPLETIIDVSSGDQFKVDQSFDSVVAMIAGEV